MTCPMVNIRASHTYRTTFHLVDVDVGLLPVVVFEVEAVTIKNSQPIHTLFLQLNLWVKELKVPQLDRKLGGKAIQLAPHEVVEATEVQEEVTMLPLETKRPLRNNLWGQAYAKTGMTPHHFLRIVC